MQDVVYAAYYDCFYDSYYDRSNDIADHHISVNDDVRLDDEPRHRDPAYDVDVSGRLIVNDDHAGLYADHYRVAGSDHDSDPGDCNDRPRTASGEGG